jgi:HEAT repeat protein
MLIRFLSLALLIGCDAPAPKRAKVPRPSRPQNPAAAPKVRETPPHPVDEARAQEIWFLGDQKSVGSLKTILNSDDHEPCRLQAVQALMTCRSPEAQEALAEALDNPLSPVRESAAYAFAADVSSRKAVVPILLRRLAIESEPVVRAAILSSLGTLGGDESFETLRRLLKEDPDARVRAAAAFALQFDPNGEAPLVEASKHEQDPWVKHAITEGIKSFQGVFKVPPCVNRN